jgi:transcription initiation factor TFIIIB Brf1 subunit/transcription initiation factor TFIIB
VLFLGALASFGISTQDPNRVGDVGSAGQEGDAELTMLGAGSHMISKQTQALFFKREKSTSAAKAFCEALSARMAATQYIREDCMRLFQRVDAAGKLKRRPLEAVVAACMLAALKIHKSARTINAIVPLTSVTARDIQKCWIEVVNHAKVEFKSERDAAAADRVGVDGAIRNADGAQYLPRFCALLRLPMVVETAAASMCRKIRDLVEGKSPTTICATALYLASRLHATEKRHIDEIASTASIAADTIKRCFRDVYAQRAEIVPAGYATAFAIESLACM